MYGHHHPKLHKWNCIIHAQPNRIGCDHPSLKPNSHTISLAHCTSQSIFMVQPKTIEFAPMNATTAFAPAAIVRACAYLRACVLVLACARAVCVHTIYVRCTCANQCVCKTQDLTDRTQTETDTDNHRRTDTDRNTDRQTDGRQD